MPSHVHLKLGQNVIIPDVADVDEALDIQSIKYLQHLAAGIVIRLRTWMVCLSLCTWYAVRKSRSLVSSDQVSNDRIIQDL